MTLHLNDGQTAEENVGTLTLNVFTRQQCVLYLFMFVESVYILMKPIRGLIHFRM